MTMTTFPETAEDAVVHVLREGREKLDTAGGDVFLNFSSVHRIDPCALREMNELAGTADDKAVKIVLCGVNVNVYKVLKLARLAARFSFVA